MEGGALIQEGDVFEEHLVIVPRWGLSAAVGSTLKALVNDLPRPKVYRGITSTTSSSSNNNIPPDLVAIVQQIKDQLNLPGTRTDRLGDLLPQPSPSPSIAPSPASKPSSSLPLG